jgi:hypothetical protein
MAEGLSPEQVEATLDASLAASHDKADNEGDWLMQLFGAAGGAVADAFGAKRRPPRRQQP